MPRIIDYPSVLDSMTRLGLKSLYHNSGAFGFPSTSPTHHLGWIGPPDSTLRPAAVSFTRSVPPPYESNLAALAIKLWTTSLPGNLWLLPMSHWAYELDINHKWLSPALQSAAIDPARLKDRNTGDALEFSPTESDSFSQLCQRLLENLSTSDYALAFPPHPVLCTLHHHKQLWWTTPDPAIYAHIERAVAPAP